MRETHAINVNRTQSYDRHSCTGRTIPRRHGARPLKPTHAGLALMGAIASLAAAGAATAQDLPGYGPAPGYGGAVRNYGDPDQTQSTDRHVTIDVIGDIIYDSNVARGSAAVAAARHISQDDEIFVPTVSI